MDSLAYITVDGLYQAAGQDRNSGARSFCDACFTGEYPVELTDHDSAAAARRGTS